MPKNTCSCGDDSETKYKNEAETLPFYTFILIMLLFLFFKILLDF